MCLKNVTKKYPKIQKGIQVGYKAYSYDKGANFAYAMSGRKLYIGKWHRSNSEGMLIKTSDSPSPIWGVSCNFGPLDYYEPAFHIFKTESAARRYGGTVFKVEYDEALCEGTNYSYGYYSPCVIARRMRIVERVLRKRKARR